MNPICMIQVTMFANGNVGVSVQNAPSSTVPLVGMLEVAKHQLLSQVAKKEPGIELPPPGTTLR